MKTASEAAAIVKSKFDLLGDLKFRHSNEKKYEKANKYIEFIEKMLGMKIENYNHRNMSFYVVPGVFVDFKNGKITVTEYPVKPGFVYIKKNGKIMASNDTFKTAADAATFISRAKAAGYQFFYFQAI